jgi:hypothetical protein
MPTYANIVWLNGSGLEIKIIEIYFYRRLLIAWLITGQRWASYFQKVTSVDLVR